jgi:hypothetical protein
MIRIKSILYLLFLIGITTSCRAQKDSATSVIYIPYTEHQYYLMPENDTLILHLFKITMLQTEIDTSQNGKVFIEFEIDTVGNVTSVFFKRYDKFFISNETMEVLIFKIKEQVRFIILNEAKSYYSILGKPIRINIVIIGRSLKSD